MKCQVVRTAMRLDFHLKTSASHAKKDITASLDQQHQRSIHAEGQIDFNR